jgi:hypothetical protein
MKVTPLSITVDMINDGRINTVLCDGELFATDISMKKLFGKTSVIAPRTNTVIYIDDYSVKRNSLLTRIRTDMNERGLSGTGDNKAYLVKIGPTRVDTFKSNQHILGATTVMVYSIPYTAPPRAKRFSQADPSKRMCSAFTFDYRRYEIKSKSWQTVDVDLQNGSGIYVHISRFEPTFNHCTASNSGLDDVLDYIEGVTGNRPTIYGFREKVTKFGAGWQTLEQYLAKLCKTTAEDTTIKGLIGNDLLENKVRTDLLDLYKAGSKTLQHGALKAYGDFINENTYCGQDNSGKIAAFIKLCRYVKQDVDQEELCGIDFEKLERLEQEVADAYPMVRALRRHSNYWYNDDDTVNTVIDYIRQMDSQTVLIA